MPQTIARSLITLLILATTAALPGAQISSFSGSEITIDLGAAAGVQEGMTGSVSLETSAGGSMTTVTIATFEVVAVEASSCRARLTQVGEGFSVEQGQRVSFDQSLQPPSPTTATIVIRSNVSGDTAFLDGRRLGPTPQTIEVEPGAHTVRVEKDGYEPAEESVTVGAGQQAIVRATLDQEPQLPSDPFVLAQRGTAAFEAGRWEEAIALYEALQAKVPEDPVARLRIAQAREKAEEEQRQAAAARQRAAEEARRQEEVRKRLANAEYLMTQGDAMAQAGEWQLAAEYYRKVAEVDSGYLDAGAKLALAECRAALSTNDFDTAAKAYDRLRGMAMPPALAARARALEAEMVYPGAAWTEPAVSMRFRYIPAGSFKMGSPASEEDRDGDEEQHRVTITRGYWMGETEVTQGQWRAVTGSNPSYFSSCGDDCPVEQLNWYDAVTYANALSRKAGLPACYEISGEDVRFAGLACRGYRLPTEAEWENAARGIDRHRYSGSYDLKTVGWYRDNSRRETHSVARKQANAWGLFDMSGNVWEWVWDWYSPYSADSLSDPTGPSRGNRRVLRGGSWVNDAASCRAAYRLRYEPGFRNYNLGLRLVRTVD